MSPDARDPGRESIKIILEKKEKEIQKRILTQCCELINPDPKMGEDADKNLEVWVDRKVGN